MKFFNESGLFMLKKEIKYYISTCILIVIKNIIIKSTQKWYTAKINFILLIINEFDQSI